MRWRRYVVDRELVRMAAMEYASAPAAMEFHAWE